MEPKFRYGFIAPVGRDRAGDRAATSERLLPPEVVEVATGIGITDYTPEGVDEAIANRYWGCVDDLVQQKADWIQLAGVPIASQLGRERGLRLIEETQQKTGLPADNANEVIINALKHLGADEIAVASRWADQLNQALADYYAAAGIKVATITTEGQWAKEAFAMSIEKGVVLAFRLSREAMKKAPHAKALLMPGGTWRSLAAVPDLEEQFGIPIVTNTTARVWQIIHQGYAPPVKGWGRLMENG